MVCPASSRRISEETVIYWTLFTSWPGAAGCTTAQLALAWVLDRGDHVFAIPGTTSVGHLEENVRTTELQIDRAVLERAAALINEETVSGPRYSQVAQREIDTEEFADLAERRETGA